MTMMAHILLIDDEPTVRKILRLMLEQAGHVVQAAADGRSGLSAFELRRYDLVITDIVMPQCDGLETISAIRMQDPQQQIVAMSGGGFEKGIDLLDLARAYGANQTLPKPFMKEALLAAVDQALAVTPTGPATQPLPHS